MTKHGKIEHRLPNGDVLVVESTRDNPHVKNAFSKAKRDLRREARETYRRLQKSAARSSA